MEKQTLNAVKQIWKFNQEAGLLDLGYDDARECAYPIEEALEGFTSLYHLDSEVAIDGNLPKYWSRELISRVGSFEGTDVDRFDKHLDAIVFAFGSLAKLGLTPQQAVKGLGIVMEANLTKLSVGKDSEGKQMKPEGFVGPEVKLQKILDERP